MLIPSNALSGMVLGLSVSESEDLARLGLLEIHFQLALAEVARAVLVGGGTLAYGGHLKETGYTAFISKELERYGRRDAPFRVYLSWSEHRKLTLQQLKDKERALGLRGEIICLDQQGHRSDPAQGRTDATPPPPTEDETRKSLTSLRRTIVSETHARLLLGGRRRGFQGVMPGVIEEAILSIEAGHPIFLIGGYGGATTDIARALNVDDAGWLPTDPQSPPVDARLTTGLEKLLQAAAATGRKSLQNGLTSEENTRLAMTNRPGEVASLIAKGLAGLTRASPR